MQNALEKKNAQKEDMGERLHLFLKGLFESVVPKHLVRENSLVLEFAPQAALSPVLQLRVPEASRRRVILTLPASPYEPLSSVMYMGVWTSTGT